MRLELKPELPIVYVRVFDPWHDKLVLSVGFWPEINGKSVKILRILTISQRELEKSIASLRTQHNELWQALKVHIFAHEHAIFLRAVYFRDNVIEFTRRIVEYAREGMHDWS